MRPQADEREDLRCDEPGGEKLPGACWSSGGAARSEQQGIALEGRRIGRETTQTFGEWFGHETPSFRRRASSPAL
jgi:hypothetical protein